MIIWNGKGYFVAIIVFLASLCMELVSEGLMGDEQFYQESAFALPLALILAGLIIKIVEQKFLLKPDGNFEGEEDKDEEPKVHSLFFIPFQYWSIIMGAIGIAVFVSRLVGN